MNELLIILTLLFTFVLVIVWYRLFQDKGMYALTVFITILANIEVVIIVQAFGIEMTLGTMLFSGTFLATDVLSEIHGKEAAKKCVWTGIATSICMILLTCIWMQYRPSVNDFTYQAVRTVFTNTPRVLIASLVVYAICQLVDVTLYHAIWNRTGLSERALWLRNNVATITSQALNAVLFNLGAFYGSVPNRTLVSIILANFLITLITSLADTPILYVARAIAKKERFGKYR